MKALLNILQSIFTLKKEKAVCQSCSYYDDRVIDDQNAFFHENKSTDRGWILDYVKRYIG